MSKNITGTSCYFKLMQMTKIKIKCLEDSAKLWPSISEKGEPTADADDWADVPDKMAHLSKNPAQQ